MAGSSADLADAIHATRHAPGGADDLSEWYGSASVQTQVNGVDQPVEKNLNFVGLAARVTDNPDNNSSDIAMIPSVVGNGLPSLAGREDGELAYDLDEGELSIISGTPATEVLDPFITPTGDLNGREIVIDGVTYTWVVTGGTGGFTVSPGHCTATGAVNGGISGGGVAAIEAVGSGVSAKILAIQLDPHWDHAHSATFLIIGGSSSTLDISMADYTVTVDTSSTTLTISLRRNNSVVKTLGPITFPSDAPAATLFISAALDGTINFGMDGYLVGTYIDPTPLFTSGHDYSGFSLDSQFGSGPSSINRFTFDLGGTVAWSKVGGAEQVEVLVPGTPTISTPVNLPGNRVHGNSSLREVHLACGTAPSAGPLTFNLTRLSDASDLGSYSILATEVAADIVLSPAIALVDGDRIIITPTAVNTAADIAIDLILA